MAIKDYSSTAADNTAISGISIQGTADVKNFDNAMRQQLADIANWTDADTLASASTVDLGSVEGMYVSITGTTTITAFGTLKAGMVKFVKFAGALTLTHNATSLILPGGANITTAAGDTAVFVSEGSGNWRCIAGLPQSFAVVRSQSFTTSGTYTPNANLIYCIVECVGGGGGGGGSVGSATASAGGGGGGAGGYARTYLSKADVAATVSVTIGAGGSAGAGIAGGAGGSTSFGVLAVASGGNGGGVGNASTTSAGIAGTGGVATGTGAITFAGAAGGSGYASGSGVTFSAPGGAGAPSFFGGGGLGRVNNTGSTGTAPGSGGGGNASVLTSTNYSGGAGAAGIVIVTEYCRA